MHTELDAQTIGLLRAFRAHASAQQLNFSMLNEFSINRLYPPIQIDGEHLNLDSSCLKIPYSVPLYSRVWVECADPHLRDGILDQPVGTRRLTLSPFCARLKRRVHRGSDSFASSSKDFLQRQIFTVLTTFVAMCPRDDDAVFDNDHPYARAGVRASGLLHGLARLFDGHLHVAKVVGVSCRRGGLQKNRT